MALAREMETFHRELPRLLAESSGNYALVKDDAVVSVWSTYEDALQEGYNRFALTPFMVKQIQPLDRVQRVTRDIRPALVTGRKLASL